MMLKSVADQNYMDKGGYTPMDTVSGLASKSSRELGRLLLEASFNLG
jgi:hypothetical protein